MRYRFVPIIFPPHSVDRERGQICIELVGILTAGTPTRRTFAAHS